MNTILVCLMTTFEETLSDPEGNGYLVRGISLFLGNIGLLVTLAVWIWHKGGLQP